MSAQIIQFPLARPPECWLTRREAAKHLGVSRSTISRWERAGLPCHRDPVRGHVVRFKASDLDRWMEGR